MTKMYKIALIGYELGVVNEDTLKNIWTPDNDGVCHYKYNGETYHFYPNELHTEELTIKVLVKHTEYCPDGACCSACDTSILGVINDITEVDNIIEKDVITHKYQKNSNGSWWNGEEYGWKIYSYEIVEIPVIN